MDCPVCHEPLIVLDHDDIEIDYCCTCRGIWLDAGELELLLGDAAGCRAFLASGEAATTREKRRRCPVCERTMDKAVAGSVVYDRCTRGDGLWLDEGELGRLIADGHADARVPEFLTRVFGKA